jgi:dipeptidyl aminopeptidase/acylaminoacyl peptidase
MTTGGRIERMVTQPDAFVENPFRSPSHFVSIPRIGELVLSPTGDRLVASVAQLDDDGGTLVTSLWALDTAGQSAARRLTRSAKGESSAAFLPDDSLLFTSHRPRSADVDAASSKDKEDADVASLWLLPANGGDARLVATRPGGITGVVTGRHTTTIIVAALSAPGEVTADQDKEWWHDRRARKVSAVLHEPGRIRHWDHHLGPSEVHLYIATIDSGAADGIVELRDLTPDAGQALNDSHPALSADGLTLVVDWVVPLPRGRTRKDIVAIDVASGARRTLASTEDGSFSFEAPVISPDDTMAVSMRASRATITEPWAIDLWLIDLATGSGRPLSAGDEPFEHSATFTADGRALVVTTDCGGRGPLYRVDIETGAATRLTGDGVWASPQVHPDGRTVFAVYAAVDQPPHPVRTELAANAIGAVVTIEAPGTIVWVPGRVDEVTAEAADGTPLRAWLVIPDGARAGAPAPLVLWVHGGPVSSWNGWHWRWNPWVLAAHGYAVLLPDPALSTGYGPKMIRRGWGQWGGAPYDDLMAITDAALERPDLNAERTAAMGGSYGGYMANWIAGRTERFKGIVSHASIWSLEQFWGTTDYPEDWADEFGYPDTNPEFYDAWSPDRRVDSIHTPMLITHGNNDYRCPVSESVRLFSELTRRGVDARFLWFASENHWILQPGDAAVWYETVLAFLDQYVLGKEWERPPLL